MPRSLTAKSPAPATLELAPDAGIAPWPVEPQERGDVFHRIRAFPTEVREWREQLVDRLVTTGQPDGVNVDGARAIVDEGIARARELERILRLSRKSDEAPSHAAFDEEALRVVSRVEVVRAPGLTPEALPSGVAVVPPNLGSALAGLMKEHAREVCRPTPECGRCEVRKFCGFFRREETKKARASSAFNTIDLFAGAGGLSEGFRRAGFLSVAACDLDDVAMRTYRLNHPETPEEAVMARDIRELSAGELKRCLDGRTLDVLIGAPPCQGFSSAGFRSKKTKTGYRATQDERNFLFEYLVELALELKPRLFLMENVPGMESAKKEDLSFFETARKMLEVGGYQTARWGMYASEHGVPQERTRSFLVGAAPGLRLPDEPAGDYEHPRRRATLRDDLLPRVTFDEATFDLPPREAGTGFGLEAWPREEQNSSRFRRYLRKFRLTSDSKLLWNHFVRYHNERDLELYALLKQGEDSVHAIERYGREDLMRYRRDVFDDKYARLRGDAPSKTIVAHLAKDGNGFIHPTQTRDISIREAARLQSFPDDFIFCGSPSDQWVQIGNAVPPVLAEAIARSFMGVLRRARG